MYDSSNLLVSFHEGEVRLTLAQRNQMRSRRDLNLARLESGLLELGKPAIVETINQGGYAMHTMTQPPEADDESRYDIDTGVVFESSEALTPRTTKNWVRDAIALKATSLKYEPESKPKCVRVTYSDGYQIDFPVFKREIFGESFKYFLAVNDEWIESSPQRFNKWFEKEVCEKSPELASPYQLRRIVRLFKYFCKVRSFHEATKFPAGLVATALAVECYDSRFGRLDQSFFETVKRVKSRSEYAAVIADGVKISDDKDILRIKRLINAAAVAVEHLRPLFEGTEIHDEADAKKIWKKVFRHSDFEASASNSNRAIAPETKAMIAASAGLLASPSLVSAASPARGVLLQSAISEAKSSPFIPQHASTLD